MKSFFTVPLEVDREPEVILTHESERLQLVEVEREREAAQHAIEIAALAAQQARTRLIQLESALRKAIAKHDRLLQARSTLLSILGLHKTKDGYVTEER